MNVKFSTITLNCFHLEIVIVTVKTTDSVKPVQISWPAPVTRATIISVLTWSACLTVAVLVQDRASDSLNQLDFIMVIRHLIIMQMQTEWKLYENTVWAQQIKIYKFDTNE